MQYQNIIYEQEGRVAIVSINRPEKRNALDRPTRLEIADVQERVAGDTSVGVLVVTGAGSKDFMSGSDLNEFGRMNPLEAYQFLNTLAQRLYTHFEELDKPVIAMINGLCLGAGCEISLACDLRIASENARFGQPELNLGIIPGSGGTQRLTRLVGAGLARELIFTGDTIDSAEALRIGLVNHVYPQTELKARTLELAQRIASRGPFSLKMAKRSMRMAYEMNLSAGLAFEALAEVACFASNEKQEGMEAFFAKRPPQFNQD